MLATLLIWLSVAVAVLALTDLFLSTAQKDWLSNAVLKLWSILDEAKAWSFADWLKEPRPIWWLAISFGLLIGIHEAWQNWTTEHERVLAEHLQWVPWLRLLELTLYTVFVTLLARVIFARLSKFTSGRLATSAALLWLIVLAGMLSIVLLTRRTDFGWFQVTSLMLLGVPSFVFLCLLMILVARALAYIGSAILYVGEFIVHRIAEYPKGPVLAISAFF